MTRTSALPVIGLILDRAPGHRSFTVVKRSDGWHWCACSHSEAYAGRATTRDAAWASCDRILVAMLRRARAQA